MSMSPQPAPLTPREAIHEKSSPYSPDGHEYRRALTAYVDSINRRLGDGILAHHTIGDTAGVEIDLMGVSQLMLLDLVLLYREAGWNVCYGCESGTGPYLVIGIDMRG